MPVLVELFTSEGCSSCPPADTLLARLDREQPVPGAGLVVLSEHVDYWNSLGWKDPFSSGVFSARQREYAARLGGDVYTPEMVVDGLKGMVGSDEGAVLQAIGAAAKIGKNRLEVSAERVGGLARVTVRGDAAGVVYIALAHDAKTSQVTHGENAGHGLSHVAVVYSMTRATAGREIVLRASAGATRVVAFVQKGNGRAVIAVGEARI